MLIQSQLLFPHDVCFTGQAEAANKVLPRELWPLRCEDLPDQDARGSAGSWLRRCQGSSGPGSSARAAVEEQGHATAAVA